MEGKKINPKATIDQNFAWERNWFHKDIGAMIGLIKNIFRKNDALLLEEWEALKEIQEQLVTLRDKARGKAAFEEAKGEYICFINFEEEI